MTAEEFSEVPIGELMAEFHDGPHATPRPAGSGPVFLGIRNISEDGRLDLSAVRHIDQADFPRWTRRVTPRPMDIVFTYEATLHRYALIPEGFHGCLGRRLALIRPRLDMVDPPFLHMALRGPEWRRTVQGHVIAGATVERIPLTDFPRFPLAVPPLPTQRRIAAVLGALEESISINERCIELLEGIVRALHHEWFVRRKLLANGDLPDWKALTLGDIADLVTDSVLPDNVSPATPYVGLEHLGRRTTTLRSWGDAGTVVSRKLLFQEGDTLFGKIRPYFHKVTWAPFAGVVSSDAMVWRARGSCPRPAFVNAVLASDRVVAEAIATSNGTRMPRADPTAMRRIKVTLPPLESPVIARFDELAQQLVGRAALLVQQNLRLAATRDLLLPRLVTGRLDISEVDLGDLLPDEVIA